MVRAIVVSLGLLTAAPAFAWGHIGFRGPRIGFVAPRVVVAPPVFVPPVYGYGYGHRGYYAPRYEHRFYGRGPGFGRGYRR